ncbi:heme peroxidase [Exidia glandulosa HHB12029]|uniref:Peroxidase n=1 Tax=Exidia glandulosa HHB12029 TaxID=1314781 RepID=A0A165FT70_EXIGL|nr:heme peroxidase [Exidia glandulosa HHB12029]
MGLRASKVLVLGGGAGVAAYVWPNPRMDQQESFRWDQDGFNHGPFAFELDPCDKYDFAGTGRSNAADWIRTAYHDMATYNVADGTGGMDSSIRFKEEQSRAENVGDSFSNTLRVLDRDASSYVSIADILALALIISMENCGGPEIDYRAGRVDAMEPNVAGVPEPQNDLDSHIASFARQGFTQEEMIGLVACGHSFGGVQHDAFPDIVPDLGDPNNTHSNAAFDSTFVHFDNNMYVEFMDGTTANPLVVGTNDTTNSDKRIFSSDGNVTMRAFAESPTLFASTCASLFARMIDTVPRGVQLTEVIKPLPVKPHAFMTTYIGNGQLTLEGDIRLWNLTENLNRTVRIVWLNSDGSTSDDNAVELLHSENQVGSALGGRITSMWYSLHNATSSQSFLTLDAAKSNSISKFSVLIDEGNGSGPRVEDQGGIGFRIEDTLMWSSSSCAPTFGTGRLDIAVRKGTSPSRVWVEVDAFSFDLGNVPIEPNAYNASLVEPQAGDDEPYEIWRVDINGEVDLFVDYGIYAEVNGVRIMAVGVRNGGDLDSCTDAPESPF